jgi:hypothetical protein
VCFLDWAAFREFNSSVEFRAGTPIEPRPPIDDKQTTRVIMMKLTVTGIEPPGEGDGQALPVVHFKGISHPMKRPPDESDSDIEGRSSNVPPDSLHSGP